ncbi:MAG: DegT/DnrJ/EryC1/StrS family aminotransferase, partial [Thermoleophilia bacterium]|nr:DegT/DnrJ/EryC1/StrS family aminotransferase [Thermoleophilia bacterium]
KLRFHGSTDKVTFEHVGFNSRLDELQAAIIRRHLPEVDAWNTHRRTVAQWYEAAGLGEFVELPTVPSGNSMIYHLYVIRTEQRDELIAGLRERGIAAAVYYGIPHHLQPVYASLGGAPGDLPVTEHLAATGVAMPMFATMSRDQVEEVVAAVRASVPARVG